MVFKAIHIHWGCVGLSFPGTREKEYWIRVSPLSLREEEEGIKLVISVPATPKTSYRACNPCNCSGPTLSMV